MKRRTASIVASASVCTVVAVAVPAACAALAVQIHHTVSYGVSQPVTTVVIDDPVGNVQVNGGASKLGVSEYQSYRDSAPVSSHTVADGTLTLTFHCASTECGIDYDVQVPDGTAVEINASAGNVTLTDLSGSVQASTRAGKITATAMSARQARFSDGAGNILIGYVSAPTSLYAGAGAGDVTLFMPGGASYKVAASSRAGAVHVTVPQSASAPSAVTATSTAGDVAVRTQE